MTSPISNLSPKQLRQAADLKEKVAQLQDQLARLLGGTPATESNAAPAGRKRRRMSASARAKIAAAQKKVWAERKKKAAGK